MLHMHARDQRLIQPTAEIAFFAFAALIPET